MKYGVFEDGFPKGFYDSDMHEGNIPDAAVPITDEQWMELIGNQGTRRFIDGEVIEYAPPVTDPTPSPITKRQLRLTLVRNGISLSAVEAAISAMPEGLEKDEAQIEWADASTFERNHPTLLFVASALGLTDAQIDAMWHDALMA